MGADGNITIIKKDILVNKFPNTYKLVYNLPCSYCSELYGVEYFHFYNGDNIWVDWDDKDEWYCKDEKEKEELKKIVDFILKEGVLWEVWT
jgi:hypothetical protein